MQSEPTVPAISKRTARRRRRAAAVLGLGFTALAATLVPLPGTTKTAKATGGAKEDEGLECSKMATSHATITDPADATKTTVVPTASIVMTAKGGYVTEPDGNSVYMWGYAPDGGTFQIPGPVLCVEEGTLVSVTLKNDLPAATSLVFPGQLDVKADEQTAVPGQSASNALASLAKSVPAPSNGKPGEPVTYSFYATHPGSYLYESGTDQGLQVQMGLTGALIVRPSTLRLDPSTGRPGLFKVDPATGAPARFMVDPATRIPGPLMVDSAGNALLFKVDPATGLPAKFQIHSTTVLDPAGSYIADPAGLPVGDPTGSFVLDPKGLYVLDPTGKLAPSDFADVAIDTTKSGQKDGRTKAYAYDDPSTAYDKSKEYLILLAETDPDVHSWVSENDGANKASVWADYPKGTDYHPRYFTINGRSFPDTIAPNHAAWLPNQPYGALAHVRPLDPTNTDVEFLPAMIHYINTQPVVDPFHPHANHETVLARDGRLLQSATVVAEQGAGQGTEQFDIPIQPGQTVDATFYWQNVDHYSSNGVTDSLYGKDYKPNPVYTAEPQIQNIIDGTYWNGTPYLGEIPANGANGKNPNKPNNNSCTGAMYNVAHSHNLAQATTYGASMGGILTLIRIDPEDNLNCQG